MKTTNIYSNAFSVALRLQILLFLFLRPIDFICLFFNFFFFKVIVHAGPNLVKTLPLAPAPAKTMKKEYSGLECTVEVVRTTEEAIDHIHKFGSSHTDVIITDNGKNIVLNLSLHLSVIRVLLISVCVATIFARVVRR